jgi:hypothetical protein
MLKFMTNFTIGVPQRTTAPGSENCPGSVVWVITRAKTKVIIETIAATAITASDLRAMLLVTYPTLGRTSAS